MLLVLALGLMSGGCIAGGSRGGITYRPADGGQGALGAPQQSQAGARTTGDLNGLGGTGGGLGGASPNDVQPEAIDPFELEEWNVVSFTDPRDQSVYDIIDGRVLIAFKNAPVLPEEDPNYFDVQRPPNDLYYSVDYPVLVGAPAVDAFIAAENLTVYSEWRAIGGIAAVLPEGQTVADAVANWPSEYPDLIECVDPDAVVSAYLPFPQGPPNDDLFTDQWALNEFYVLPPGQHTRYDIRMQSAWRNPGGFGSSTVVVAVLDTGVAYNAAPHDGHANDPVDMRPNSTPYGASCGDKKSSTRFKLRLDGGGEPSKTWEDWSPGNAIALGHGTCIAGIISAAVNNDGDNDPVDLDDGDDTAGVAYYPQYFPVEMKFKGKFSGSAVINAYEVIGSTKGVYKPSECGQTWVPYYNIEVVNCSFGNYKSSTCDWRQLNNLSKYMLFVCATADDGLSNKTPFPASHPRAMSVAAYNSSGMRAGFSNWNWDTSIAAPGVGIRAPDLPGVNSYGYQLGFVPDPLMSWDGFGGTSVAAPHVAGVAALVTSKYLSWSPNQVRQRIIDKGRDLPDHDFSDRGIRGLDANAALNGP